MKICKALLFLQIYPSDVVESYCGKSYIIVVLDSLKQVVEKDETNNIFTTTIFLDCENGMYIFWAGCV